MQRKRRASAPALAKEKEGDSVPTKLALPLLFVLQDESGRYVMTNTSVSDPNQDLYYSYEYDTYGNIRSAEAHGSYHISDDYTNDYEYNNPKWLDLLTGFNTEPILYEGQTLVDGEIVGDPTSGNPISYFNGTRWEFVWENGRQLASASTTDGDTTIDIDYTYDINGLRTSKTITRTTTTEEEDDGHTHTYTTTVVEPTCTEDGYTLYECECGYSYTDNVVDATGHTYSSVVTAPTCLNAGYTTYTCTCGDSYTDNVVDALGHNYVESETETGSVFTCSRCGDSYTGHQHTYTGSVVAPTCIMRGYTVYTCSCGDTYMGNYVPALGHDGVEVGRTQTMITYLCNRCGATYQEPIVVDPNPPVEMSLRRSTVSVETEHHEYVYASGKLLREVITTTDVDGNVTTETLDFTYDASGSPYTVTRIVGTSSSTYYYVVNAQGDVIRLVSANGATVAEYAYDPWGRVISATGTVAEANPLRYRGYYYDAETEFYYLQSRYYDPVICRFINADGYASTGQGFHGYNMFAYCLNCPANCRDTTGFAVTGTYTYVASDSCGIEPELPQGCFQTMDQAATAFVSGNYGNTKNNQREYGAYIFSREWYGTTIYFLGDPIEGSKTEVWLELTDEELENVANGTWSVCGSVHTHVDDSSFSSIDHDTYDEMPQPFAMYVGNSTFNLYRYDSNSTKKSGDHVGGFVMSSLYGKNNFIARDDVRVN